MKKDVLAHNPDIVVIFLGTNDLRVEAPKVYVTLKDYKNNLETMIQQSEEGVASAGPIKGHTHHV